VRVPKSRPWRAPTTNCVYVCLPGRKGALRPSDDATY
jgi:hypothetical protein